MSSLVDQWLHGRSRETQRAYRRDVLAFLAGRDPAALAVADVQAFVQARAHLATASRNRALAAVKSFLRYAHETGAIPKDVGRFVKTERARDRLSERILSQEQVRRMIEGEPDARNRLVIRLLYVSGLRVGELVGQRFSDCHEGAGGVTLTVFGKGAKTRYVLIPDSVWSELLAVRFEDMRGSTYRIFHLSTRQVERIVKNAAIRVGLPSAVSPHWLRHAHATHAIENGAPIHLVQATLGHSSVATTSRYLHARPMDSSARYLGL